MLARLREVERLAAVDAALPLVLERDDLVALLFLLLLSLARLRQRVVVAAALALLRREVLVAALGVAGIEHQAAPLRPVRAR